MALDFNGHAFHARSRQSMNKMLVSDSVNQELDISFPTFEQQNDDNETAYYLIQSPSKECWQ